MSYASVTELLARPVAPSPAPPRAASSPLQRPGDRLVALLAQRAQRWAWAKAHARRADIFDARFGHVYWPPARPIATQAPSAAARSHAHPYSRPTPRPRHRRRTRYSVGFASRNVFNLGSYMDEVDKEVMALNADVKRWSRSAGGHDWLPQAFFAEWHRFVDASPHGVDDTTVRPYGWRDYYGKHRGLIDRMTGNVDLVWAEVEAFEDELTDFHARAREKKATPTEPVPEPGYQPPPPLWEQPETAPIFEGARTALEWVAIIGVLAGAGYLLHGLGTLKR